ncbi:type II toxin-antitoxin system VapB family antitoxin [candidate division KSB1 bacterium]|nr:type II toxin-antitoxin system VapB family antitoxin [candidate division KSB1 bacterium]
MQRTNVYIDENLVEEGLKLSKLRTKKELINRALKEFVNQMRRKEILNFEGKVEWEGDLREMRRSRI